VSGGQLGQSQAESHSPSFVQLCSGIGRRPKGTLPCYVFPRKFQAESQIISRWQLVKPVTVGSPGRRLCLVGGLGEE
jgi:hypothetical protein